MSAITQRIWRHGNVILMATICIVIFWVFMALRPAFV